MSAIFPDMTLLKGPDEASPCCVWDVGLQHAINVIFGSPAWNSVSAVSSHNSRDATHIHRETAVCYFVLCICMITHEKWRQTDGVYVCVCEWRTCSFSLSEFLFLCVSGVCMAISSLGSEVISLEKCRVLDTMATRLLPPMSLLSRFPSLTMNLFLFLPLIALHLLAVCTFVFCLWKFCLA